MSNSLLSQYPEDVRHILVRYIGGEPLKTIAESNNVSAALISRKLKACGISVSRTKVGEQCIQRIFEHITQKKPFEDLALELLLPIPKLKEIYNRRKSKLAGNTKYESITPCPTCGKNERYCTDNKCVNCVSQNRKRRTLNKNWKEDKVTNSGTTNLKLVKTIEEKTLLIRKAFADHGYEIPEEWKFEKYDSPIFFTPSTGIYSGLLCKTKWNQFLKHKGINLYSLVDPTSFIVNFCAKSSRIVDEGYLKYQFTNKKKHGKLKVKFYVNHGPYAGFDMIQDWARILEGREITFKSIIDKTAAIRALFAKKGRKVPTSWKYNSFNEQVPFHPTSGLYEGILCKQKACHVLSREQGIDWRAVQEKQRVIEKLLPEGYRLIEDVKETSLGSSKLRIKCSEGHNWSPSIVDFISRNSICGKCAARSKNPYGGEGKELFIAKPEYAHSDSYLYFVRVKGQNTDHYKIGIANDVRKRGGRHYTEIIYKQRTTRAISWCVEQVLKSRTRTLRSGHLDSQIEGWTEFRSLNLDLKKYIGQAQTLIEPPVSG